MLASLFTMSPFSSTKMLDSLANGAPNGNKYKIAGELSWHLEVAKRAVSNYMAIADGKRRGAWDEVDNQGFFCGGHKSAGS